MSHIKHFGPCLLCFAVQVVDGDMESLKGVMGYIRDCKKRHTETTELMEPLNAVMTMLRRHEAISEEDQVLGLKQAGCSERRGSFCVWGGMELRTYGYIHIPLNLANTQTTSNKQATGTSPFCSGYCSVSSLRALLYSRHPRAQVVPLLNPNFEPKTHRCCPGAGGAKLGDAPQNCAFSAPKQPFLAQNGPGTC